MFLAIFAAASLFSSSSASSILWEALDADLLHKHGIRYETFHQLLSTAGTKTVMGTHSTYMVCGPITTDQKTAPAPPRPIHHRIGIDSNSKIAYVNNADATMCTVSHLTTEDVEDMQSSAGLQLHRYPAFLKIHPSVMEYLSSRHSPKHWSSTMRRHQKTSSEVHIRDDLLLAESMQLSIQVSPIMISSENSLRSIWVDILHDLSSGHADMRTDHSEAWEGAIAMHSYDKSATACALPASAEVDFISHSIQITDLSGLDKGCVIHLVHLAVHREDVLRVSIHSRPTLMNYESRGLTQSGRIRVEPYREAGLTGSGQICGVGDSGVNDVSCYFLDDSHAYSTVTTARTGEVQPLRRKVIQYVPYADGEEDQAGHGTHVCGSVAGNSNSQELSQVDGMAPDGKIAFYDLGITNRDFLKVPAVNQIFDAAYTAGARIHTNSWGNNGGLYGQMSYDVDAYLSENEDFFLLFAAGNQGHEGANSIIAPGNAKNCLSVGAAQLRGVLGDKPFDDKDSRMASFSSIGPTFDGRIKPDVAAPGDFIMSAYAGPTNNLEAALAAGTKVDSTCSAHQMSGTSMATPITAGTALLVRQFFMDAPFWATLCGNKSNKFCRGGAFSPSGFLMKALFLHSGRSVSRYSDPAYDAEPTAYASFPLGSPPDNFQGYGFVTLTNILPLGNGKGLKPSLKLYVFDWLKLSSHSTYKATVTINADSQEPLKITIAWFDPPSVLGAVSSLLIHDLDLVVRTPDGTLHWGNELYQGDKSARKKGHGDKKNPNEQVVIERPKCADTCTFDVFIRAHAIYAKNFQNVALVVTSSGTVTDPQPTQEWFGSDSDDGPVSRHTNQLYSNFNVQLSTTLKGAEYESTSFAVTTCGHLRLAEVKLSYNHLHCTPEETLASYIELTLQAPGGKAVSIGGVDSSVGKAKITTEWPDSWNDYTNGEYTAEIDLTDAKIFGQGNWNMFVMNSYSSSGRVAYNVSTTLVYYGGPFDSCAPTAQPTASVIKDPYKIPPDELLSDFDTAYEIPFQNLPMAVKEISSPSSAGTVSSTTAPAAILAQDRRTIATFAFPNGVLQSIKLSLDAYDSRNYETFGTDGWLLAVIITSPDEKTTIQVGGYHWLARKDRLYYRHWPDPWLGRMSAGLKWSSTRDVSAAGLTGTYTADHVAFSSSDSSKGKWLVEIAMGSSYPRNAVNFTGTVTLLFDNLDCAGDKECQKSVIKLNPLNAYPTLPSSITKVTYGSKLLALLNPLTLVGILILYLLIFTVLRVVNLLKVKNNSHVAVVPSSNQENVIRGTSAPSYGSVSV